MYCVDVITYCTMYANRAIDDLHDSKHSSKLSADFHNEDCRKRLSERSEIYKKTYPVVNMK